MVAEESSPLVQWLHWQWEDELRSTDQKMSARMVKQSIATLGLPRAMYITAKAVDNEMVMAMVTAMCKVGVVTILNSLTAIGGHDHQYFN